MILKKLVICLVVLQVLIGQEALCRVIDMNKAAQNRPFDNQKYEQMKQECFSNVELATNQFYSNPHWRVLGQLHLAKSISDQTKRMLNWNAISYPQEVHRLFNELSQGGSRLIIN